MLLPTLIFPVKTRYVEGRQILNNIILVQDHIHSLHSFNQLGMILKLDMSKALDKVSW